MWYCQSKAAHEKSEQFQGFIGQSLTMQEVYNNVERAAPSAASVFVTGPSGTGKEVTAKAIHDLSPRKDKPFIALNCAAIPSELMESEIFGHVKGAFSGALIDRVGAVEAADGGTLFLDEVCEMEAPLQAKLLRFLQDLTYRRLGGTEELTADVRIISASHQHFEQLITDKLFREDLFYRLNVLRIFDKTENIFEHVRSIIEILCASHGSIEVSLLYEILNIDNFERRKYFSRLLSNELSHFIQRSSGKIVFNNKRIADFFSRQDNIENDFYIYQQNGLFDRTFKRARIIVLP